MAWAQQAGHQALPCTPCAACLHIRLQGCCTGAAQQEGAHGTPSCPPDLCVQRRREDIASAEKRRAEAMRRAHQRKLAEADRKAAEATERKAGQAAAARQKTHVIQMRNEQIRLRGWVLGLVCGAGFMQSHMLTLVLDAPSELASSSSWL